MYIAASRLIIAALISGVAGDLLLRGGSMWRLGFTLWILGLVATVFVIDRSGGRERKLMLAEVAAAALGLVLRDAPMLYTIDFLSLMCMGVLVFADWRRADCASVRGGNAAAHGIRQSVCGAAAAHREFVHL